MPNTTKQALEESLKHMLLKKPLDKITIRDITEDCGISRMAFYYHFQGHLRPGGVGLYRGRVQGPPGKKDLSRPGRRGFRRSLRRCWKTSPLF